MEGTVKFYNFKKRFGFITADDGKDYFFHVSGLVPDTRVEDGMKVSFELEESDKGPIAVQIKAE
jgi:cold shock protein